MGWVFARTLIPTGTKTPEQPTNLKIPSPRLLKLEDEIETEDIIAQRLRRIFLPAGMPGDDIFVVVPRSLSESSSEEYINSLYYGSIINSGNGRFRRLESSTDRWPTGPTVSHSCPESGQPYENGEYLFFFALLGGEKACPLPGVENQIEIRLRVRRTITGDHS